ncbi:MAG TPA: CBS domain-containing protein [Tepidisphaeraceae bacterium]|nr:CBS domain-containing protein [Tepidisphaeraceae bacterium]
MATTCPSCGAENLEGADECANCGMDLHAVDLPRPASQIEQSVMQLPLTSLKMTAVHAVAPDVTLEVAVQTLVRQKVDLLEVVEHGRLMGVLSVRDVMTRVGADYRRKLNRPISEFMTPNPETLPPDAPVTFVINKMDVGGYRHIPVVQGERMLGVVSASDVIDYLVKHSKEQVAPAGATTSHGVEGVGGEDRR